MARKTVDEMIEKIKSKYTPEEMRAIFEEEMEALGLYFVDEKPIMRLRDILDKYHSGDIYISYRTNGPNGEDLFAGACLWDGKKLIPLDGDGYSLDDVITYYEMYDDENDEDKFLAVWYKSNWTCG